MNRRLLAVIPPGALAVCGAALLLFWLRTGTSDALVRREPGMEGPGVIQSTSGDAGEAAAPPVAGEPVRSAGVPSDVPGSWPWFRGPGRNNICDDGVRLARDWPDEGPDVLWTVPMGPGHAGAAVSDGCVYVLDYDVDAEADTIRCLSLDDGREIWRNGYPVKVGDSHGMSRTVPAVVDGYVITFGPKSHVACWKADTGECLWLKDLVLDYGTRVPEWHAAQCPLVDNGRVILAPAAEAFMVAIDYTAGQVVWESPKLHTWEMTHSSIAPMEFQGRRMYVYCGSGGVAGIAADDGSVLWDSTEWVGRMATCPTPVPLDDGRIFFCSGYKAGSLMVELKERDGRLEAESLFRLRPNEFESEQQTPILYEGHLFGVRTKPGGEQLVCLGLDGTEVWNSGPDKYGRGPYLIADGLIYLMDDDGTLSIVEATPEAYRRLDQFQVFERGHDAWGPMALVGGRLILRDLTRMACVDVAQQ